MGESRSKLWKDSLIQVTNIGGKDHYITGVYVIDGTSVRLTQSIGEVKLSDTPDEEKDSSIEDK